MKRFVNFRKFRFNSIFLRNFLVISILEVCVFSVLTVIYADKIKENTMSEIMESNYNELKRSGESLDVIMEQLSSCAYYIANEGELKLLNIAADSKEEADVIRSLRDMLYNYKNIFGYVDSIFIYIEDLDSVITEQGKEEINKMTDLGWLSMYNESEERKGKEVYKLKARCKNEDYPFYLTMLYPIYNSRNEKTGAIVINIDQEELNTAIGRSYKDQQQLYMIDKDGNLLYSSVSKAIKYPELLPEDWEKTLGYCMDDQEVKKRNAEDTEKFVTVMESDTGGYYILYSSSEYYQERMTLTEQYITRNVIWMFAFCMIMSCVLTMHTYRPIRFIMNEIEEGDEIRDAFIEESNKTNEIQYISNMIRSTKRKNVKLKMEAEEWIERLGRAQVQALQSQINPHFLYNTLDSINWMVMEKIGADNQVSKAIYSLAQLLRMSMKRTSYLIPLEEELEHARLYLELLNIRYPGKIKVHWEIGEELKNVMVIRLCLQPIIENSAKHGLRSRRYCGDIYIRADMVNSTLVIRIEDNGVGMNEADCIQMNRILNTEYQMVDNHVGIKNVNQRMKILFGENYGIQLRPRDEGGLVVVMCFPGEGEKPKE